MTRMIVSLGSNVEPRPHLAAAVRAIGRRYPIRAVSPTYRTAAVGDTDQPDFWNLAVEIEADDSPVDVQKRLHDIERALGRRRDPRRPCGPRVIDLDLVLAEGFTDRIEELELPSPLLAREAFVAVPVADLVPHLPHPTLGVSLAEVAQSTLAACSTPPRLLPEERFDV